MFKRVGQAKERERNKATADDGLEQKEREGYIHEEQRRTQYIKRKIASRNLIVG